MLTRSLTRSLTAPLSRAITQAGGGGGSFDPMSRFASGEEGVLFDPSVRTSLFQDAAGTVPVTAIGQTVKRINDISGRGHHVSQASAAWTLQNDGANDYIQTDGAWRLESSSFAWGADKATCFCAMQSDTTGVNKTMVQFGAPASVTGSFEFGLLVGGWRASRRGSGSVGDRYTANIGTARSVLTSVVDLAGATQATECPFMRIDGVQPSLTNSGAADSGGGNFGTYTIRFGGSASFFLGRIYAFGVVAATSTESQLQDLERWCASKSGVSLPFEQAPAPQFLDTGAELAQTGFTVTSAFSRAAYSTSATKVAVTYRSTARGAVSTKVQLGVYVDGVFYEAIAPLNANDITQIVSLPAGAKIVEFVGGQQISPSETFPPLGTFFISASANAPMTPVTTAATNRIVIYGDSIAVGDGSTTPPAEAWGILMRSAYAPDSVAFEGFGFRSLNLDAFDATSRAAFVAKIVAYAPSRIWLAIGTNDYGRNRWLNLSDFGTAYGATLDDLNAALPGVPIYAQTPIVRTAGTNAFGQSLQDYRDQITTAVSTRTSFCTLVDGTAILTLSDLADGVHPSTAGHALYAAYVQGVLGI